MIWLKNRPKNADLLRMVIEDGIARLSADVQELKVSAGQQERQTEELGRSVERNSVEVQKQSISLEDLIEMLEQQQGQESLDRKYICELEKEKDMLLSIIEDYQEMIWQLKAASSCQDTSWVKQLIMAEKKVCSKMGDAGLDVIDGECEPVNYDLHDIITTEITDNEALHGTVKQVFSPGCRYKGKVIKKCRISAWRYTG